MAPGSEAASFGLDSTGVIVSGVMAPGVEGQWPVENEGASKVAKFPTAGGGELARWANCEVEEEEKGRGVVVEATCEEEEEEEDDAAEVEET